MKHTHTYDVMRQHKDGGGQFLCPAEVQAETPRQAARQWFSAQLPSLQRCTTALLVSDISGAYVFPVRTVEIPVVADAALCVGAF